MEDEEGHRAKLVRAMNTMIPPMINFGKKRDSVLDIRFWQHLAPTYMYWCCPQGPDDESKPEHQDIPVKKQHLEDESESFKALRRASTGNTSESQSQSQGQPASGAGRSGDGSTGEVAVDAIATARREEGLYLLRMDTKPNIRLGSSLMSKSDTGVTAAGDEESHPADDHKFSVRSLVKLAHTFVSDPTSQPYLDDIK